MLYSTCAKMVIGYAGNGMSYRPDVVL